MSREEAGSRFSGKTIVGIVLIPVALLGLCCGGVTIVAGIGKRFLHSEEPVHEQVQEQIKQEKPVPKKERIVKEKALPQKEAVREVLPVATKESARLGEVEVWVVHVWQWQDVNGNLLIVDGQKSPLHLRLRMVNRSQNRKIDYESWQKRGGLYPLLTDEHGNKYRSELAGSWSEKLGHVDEGTTGPNEWIDDVLTFESPIDRAESLVLMLNGQAFGEKGFVRFAIPRKSISKESIADFIKSR